MGFVDRFGDRGLNAEGCRSLFIVNANSIQISNLSEVQFKIGPGGGVENVGINGFCGPLWRYGVESWRVVVLLEFLILLRFDSKYCRWLEREKCG